MAGSSQAKTTWHDVRDEWAKIWFEKLCRFRGRKPQATWEFTADDVIAFLRDHLRRKTPAWKRLKIIQSLICYRRYVQTAPFDDLKFIQTNLDSLARAEKVKEARLRVLPAGLDMAGAFGGLGGVGLVRVANGKVGEPNGSPNGKIVKGPHVSAPENFLTPI